MTASRSCSIDIEFAIDVVQIPAKVSGVGPQLWGIDLAQSWAEALAAFGTTAAFAVAAFVYRRAERDRREGVADQARLIYFISKRDHESVRVLVRNLSSAPVYFVAATVRLRPNDGPVEETGDLLEVLEPTTVGEQVWVRMAAREQTESGGFRVTGPVAQLESVTIAYIDAHGRQWRRTGNDQPVLVTREARLRRLLRAVATWWRLRRQD